MGKACAEMEMKTLALLTLVPLVTLAALIAAEQEDSTSPHSGFCPEYPDHDAAWYEYPAE